MKETPRGFNEARRRAEEYAHDPQKTEDLLKKAREKAAQHKGRLEKVWKDLEGFFRLIKAWKTGSYKVSWQTVVFPIAAILYFLNPFDIIPDFIPLLGYLDDATVIAFVASSLREEIVAFLEWEQHPKA